MFLLGFFGLKLNEKGGNLAEDCIRRLLSSSIKLRSSLGEGWKPKPAQKRSVLEIVIEKLYF